MIALTVQVAAARDCTGIAFLRDGSRIASTGPVVATATAAIAAQRGNPACDPLRVWGHPPFGGYRLLRCVSARPELAGEYGTHLLLFEAESGLALEAESFGRLALLAYGGPPGRDGRMRRTQGGLRLANRMLLEIVGRLGSGNDMTLVVEALVPPAWWQFWRRPEPTQPLSETLLAPLAPPADEASVMEELLMSPALVGRRRKPAGRDDSRDWDDDRDRDDRRERTSQDSGGDTGSRTFRGKGGESAGAGASGGWDAAPGRNPGVDQAGRIVAGAAVAATAAAMLGETARAAAQTGGEAAESVADPGPAGDGGAESGTEAATTTTTSY